MKNELNYLYHYIRIFTRPIYEFSDVLLVNKLKISFCLKIGKIHSKKRCLRLNK